MKMKSIRKQLSHSEIRIIFRYTHANNIIKHGDMKRNLMMFKVPVKKVK